MKSPIGRVFAKVQQAQQAPQQAQFSSQDYACLQRIKAPLLEHLVRFHEQHDERFTNWLVHFDAILWLKLALVHGYKGLFITMEYDLRQYLKLSVSVGLDYFQRHSAA